MKIIHPREVREAIPPKQGDVYALALYLSRTHPQRLEPSVKSVTGPSGRQYTNLYWHDIMIRIFFSERSGYAHALGASRTKKYVVSKTPVYYRAGDLIDSNALQDLYNPTRYDPPGGAL